MIICYIFEIIMMELLSMRRSYLDKTEVIMLGVHLVGQVIDCKYWAGQDSKQN
jgi:hypothetical protein